jgi:tripartite-type tricarboxylate transporter receptor subunit TctC
MQEAGFKGFNIAQFQGLLAPAGTDPVIIARLYNEVVKALRAPGTVKRLVDDGGNEIIGSSPKDFSTQIQNELKMYAKLLQDAKIQAE